MLKPVDVRKGVDKLSAIVQSVQASSACDGKIYIFRNKAGTRIKAIRWDGNGVWLSMRRLHKGRFHWPAFGENAMALTPEQFEMLVMGLDWQRLDLGPPNWEV